MKRNRVFRLLASLTAVVLCMTAFSVTAFAGGGDGDYYTGEPAETTPEPTEEPATGGMEPEDQPLTPEGNATLVDDYYGDKQLITVTTKAGNYFYILIDRANKDKEIAVHFLNQVDEADLMALMEDGQTEEQPAVCTCVEKCQAGAVNTACPVCAVNMSECAGKAPEVEPEPEPEPKPTKKAVKKQVKKVKKYEPEEEFEEDDEEEEEIQPKPVKEQPAKKPAPVDMDNFDDDDLDDFKIG